MTKDEIIANLMGQLKAANEQIAALTSRVAELTAQVARLTASLKSSKESVKDKEDTLRKEKRKNKGLVKIIRNKGDQQKPAKLGLTDEERKVLEEAAAVRRKLRGNSGARRDRHMEA